MNEYQETIRYPRLDTMEVAYVLARDGNWDVFVTVPIPLTTTKLDTRFLNLASARNKLHEVAKEMSEERTE